jgi:hypothetical protein
MTAAVDANDYYSFTMTPATGFTMTLQHLLVSDSRSSTGPRTFVLRSSLDNFTADLGLVTSHTSLTANDFVLGTAFATLNAQVEFRIYAYGSTGSTGTFRIDNVKVAGFTTAM